MMNRAFLRHLLLAVLMCATATDGAVAEYKARSISLRHYIGTTMDDYVDYSLDNVNTLQTRMIDSRPTVLYIHGFTETLENKSVRTIVQAYLTRNDHNVIAVNYAKLADGSYPEVVKNAAFVGATIAKTFDKMVGSNFDPNKLHIVGHSLGGQVAGYIGRKGNFSVARITALDPAGPLFERTNSHLSSADARFVDIIHTDGGFYGMQKAAGTVDFYPNGGKRVQPGCPKNFTFYSTEEFCSHHRSWWFYAESLADESSFLGVQCPTSSRFYSGGCNDNVRAVMGYGVPRNVNGNFYLTTANRRPYGLRKEGSQVIVD